MAKGKEKPKTTYSRNLLEEMLRLSTAAFGLVAALAWNDAVKLALEQHLRPYLGQGAGVAYSFIYAIIITILAVTVTYFLAKIVHRKNT